MRLTSYVLQHFWELARFGISGVTAVFLGIATLYFFVDVLSWWYVAGSASSFLIVFIYVFILQKYWTFREMSAKRIPTQSLQNVVLSAFNLVFNIIAIYVLVDIAGIHHLIAQTIIYGIVGAIDFFVYKYIIFTPMGQP